MRVYKDKLTGKYKSSPNSPTLYDTKEQCQRTMMDELASRLAEIRKKIETGCLNYGR